MYGFAFMLYFPDLIKWYVKRLQNIDIRISDSFNGQRSFGGFYELFSTSTKYLFTTSPLFETQGSYILEYGNAPTTSWE